MLGFALDIFGNIIFLSFIILDYLRVEIVAATKKWPMKL
jgi:hypothetical protein